MRTTSQKEVDAVSGLPGPARFAHFIKRAADDETAWGIWNDGWMLMSTDDGALAFPLLPAREYAERLCAEDWSECVPRDIALADLLAMLAEMEVRPTKVAVSPPPTGQGVLVPATELRAAHCKEPEQYA